VVRIYPAEGYSHVIVKNLLRWRPLAEMEREGRTPKSTGSRHFRGLMQIPETGLLTGVARDALMRTEGEDR